MSLTSLSIFFVRVSLSCETDFYSLCPVWNPSTFENKITSMLICVGWSHNEDIAGFKITRMT